MKSEKGYVQYRATSALFKGTNPESGYLRGYKPAFKGYNALAVSEIKGVLESIYGVETGAQKFEALCRCSIWYDLHDDGGNIHAYNTSFCHDDLFCSVDAASRTVQWARDAVSPFAEIHKAVSVRDGQMWGYDLLGIQSVVTFPDVLSKELAKRNDKKLEDGIYKIIYAVFTKYFWGGVAIRHVASSGRKKKGYPRRPTDNAHQHYHITCTLIDADGKVIPHRRVKNDKKKRGWQVLLMDTPAAFVAWRNGMMTKINKKLKRFCKRHDLPYAPVQNIRINPLEKQELSDKDIAFLRGLAGDAWGQERDRRVYADLRGALSYEGRGCMMDAVKHSESVGELERAIRHQLRRRHPEGGGERAYKHIRWFGNLADAKRTEMLATLGIIKEDVEKKDIEEVEEERGQRIGAARLWGVSKDGEKWVYELENGETGEISFYEVDKVNVHLLGGKPRAYRYRAVGAIRLSFRKHIASGG